MQRQQRAEQGCRHFPLQTPALSPKQLRSPPEKTPKAPATPHTAPGASRAQAEALCSLDLLQMLRGIVPSPTSETGLGGGCEPLTLEAGGAAPLVQGCCRIGTGVAKQAKATPQRQNPTEPGSGGKTEGSQVTRAHRSQLPPPPAGLRPRTPPHHDVSACSAPRGGSSGALQPAGTKQGGLLSECPVLGTVPIVGPLHAHLLRGEVPLCLRQHLIAHHELADGGGAEQRGVVMGMELPVPAVLLQVGARGGS